MGTGPRQQLCSHARPIDLLSLMPRSAPGTTTSRSMSQKPTQSVLVRGTRRVHVRGEGSCSCPPDSHEERFQRVRRAMQERPVAAVPVANQDGHSASEDHDSEASGPCGMDQLWLCRLAGHVAQGRITLHRDRGHQNGEDDGVAQGEWRGLGHRRGRCAEKVGCAHHGPVVGTTGGVRNSTVPIRPLDLSWQRVRGPRHPRVVGVEPGLHCDVH